MSQYLSMFQHANPSDIARRIKEVRPDAPDDAVWTATQELYKLTSGNIREQLAAASMIKFLKGDETRRAIATGSVGGAPTVAAQNAATAQGNLAERQKTQQRLSSQFQQKVQQFNSRLAETRANRNSTERRVGLQALLRDIDKQLYPGFGAPPLADEEKAAFMKQREEIANELRNMSGMKPLPSAPVATPP